MHHPLRPLAQDHGCTVELCEDCNVIHVTVGPVTMRLQPQAMAHLHAALGRALARLGAQVPTAASEGPPPPLAN